LKQKNRNSLENSAQHFNEALKCPNKGVLKYFEELHNYLPKVNHLVKEKPLSTTQQAKNKNHQLAQAMKDQDQPTLEDALDQLFHLNSLYLDNSQKNLGELEKDDPSTLEAQNIFDHLKTNLPIKEKNAKKKLDHLKKNQPPSSSSSPNSSDSNPKYKKWKKKLKEKEGEFDYDDSSEDSDDDNKKNQTSINDDSSDSSEDSSYGEEIDELSLLFPDLQLNGEDVEQLLQNLNDPNFGLKDGNAEEMKKKRRNRKKNKKGGKINDDDDDVGGFQLFGRGEGTIRLNSDEWNQPTVDLNDFYPLMEEEILLDSPSPTQKGNFSSLDPLDFEQFENLKDNKLNLQTADVIDFDDQLQKIGNFLHH
jgi:hypothetical protein